jgi:hypothetical protein
VSEAFTALIPELAKALGGTVTRTDEGGGPNGNAEITVDGVPIAPSWSEYQKRLTIGVSWPRLKDGSYLSPRYFMSSRDAPDRVDINCNIARGAEAIAKDVRRRLLPLVTPLYAQAQEYKAQREEQFRQVEAVEAMFIARFGYTKPQFRGDSLYRSDDPGHIRVIAGDSIYFERFYLPRDLAIKVLELISKERGS